MNENNLVFNARPSPSFISPSYIYSYTFLRQDEIDNLKEKNHLNGLLESESFNETYFSSRLSIYCNLNVELRVETHHEFICYIWIFSDFKDESVVTAYMQKLPAHWQDIFPGELLTRTVISFEKSNKEVIPMAKLSSLFGSNQLIGNFVERESARIWTDFYANNSQNFLRIVVEDFSLGPRRCGRLAQHLIELENYRSLAETAFPIAEKIVFELKHEEVKLAQAIQNISTVSDTNEQQELLHQLLDLSNSSENWRNRTSHRFSATIAYKHIFVDRLNSLDESLVLGYQPFSSFLSRRTMPTFRTCEAANERLNLFIKRIDRAVTLLTTRIRSTMEQQNNALLKSVNKQNKQQIKLQETIEAFAIVAISYNGTALIKLFLESLSQLGIKMNIALWTLISIPTIFVLSMMLMRYLSKKK